jgi:hypothetical protein
MREARHHGGRPDRANAPPPLPALLPAGAPAHWRRRRQATCSGAFAGLRVLLHCAADELPSAEALAAMIRAGGGEVVKGKAPFTASTTAAANLAVLPSRRQAAGDKWPEALQASGLVCVTPSYLVDWVARPWGVLDEHVVCGRRRGGEVARLEAGRGGRQGSLAGG